MECLSMVYCEYMLFLYVMYKLFMVKMYNITGEHCLMGEKDGRQVLTCTWKKQPSPDLDFSSLFEGASSNLYNPQVSLIQHV